MVQTLGSLFNLCVVRRFTFFKLVNSILTSCSILKNHLVNECFNDSPGVTRLPQDPFNIQYCLHLLDACLSLSFLDFWLLFFVCMSNFDLHMSHATVIGSPPGSILQHVVSCLILLMSIWMALCRLLLMVMSSKVWRKSIFTNCKHNDYFP